MKILTIGSTRAGGYYFTKSLADTYKLTLHHQPPLDNTLETILDTDDISIKICTLQMYEQFIEQNISVDEYVYQFYNKISKYTFDKIILLDRVVNIQYKEAIANLIEQGPGKSHVEWVYDENFKKSITKEMWDNLEWYTNATTLWMKTISNKFNLPIIYYDDLYYNTESVDLQGLEFKPDLSKRLRKEITPNTIL